jgi:beta-N-acetylhexosaminidase
LSGEKIVIPLEPGKLIWLGYTGVKPPDDVIKLLNDGMVGGIILFARNLGHPSEIKEHTRIIQNSWGGKGTLPLGIDQEGGRVKRIKFTNWPSASLLAATDDIDFIKKVGKAMGDELSHFGFNVNFAPVLDILTNTSNRVIGDRAFGKTHMDVVKYGGAWLEGFSKSGVGNCGKHFPGHGSTLHDSHKTLPKASSTLEQLEMQDLIPFTKLSNKLDMIMTAHVLFSKIDNSNPATFSEKILSLASKNGFKGIMVSDDLEMGALASYPENQLGYKSLQAGTDMVMVCSKIDTFHQVREGIIKEGEKNSQFSELLKNKISKVESWRNTRLNRFSIDENSNSNYENLKELQENLLKVKFNQ